MVRTKSLLVFLVLFGFGMNAHAASGGGNIIRGGLGFLFPDNNSFVNPGQFAESHAMSVEGYYGRTNQDGAAQTATPSFVYGNGTIGLGVYGSRSAVTLLGTPTTDTVGAGLGVSLMKGRATLGVRYDKTLGATDNGIATATLTLNPAQRKGISLGVGYTRNISSTTSQVTAGLGYSFMSNNNVEVNFTLPDISALSNWNLGAYLTTMRGPFYLGGGYVMVMNSSVTNNGAAARLGVVAGRMVDVSIWANYFFAAGNPVNYGASFRASF